MSSSSSSSGLVDKPPLSPEQLQQLWLFIVAATDVAPPGTTQRLVYGIVAEQMRDQMGVDITRDDVAKLVSAKRAERRLRKSRHDRRDAADRLREAQYRTAVQQYEEAESRLRTRTAKKQFYATVAPPSLPTRPRQRSVTVADRDALNALAGLDRLLQSNKENRVNEMSQDSDNEVSDTPTDTDDNYDVSVDPADLNSSSASSSSFSSSPATQPVLATVVPAEADMASYFPFATAGTATRVNAKQMKKEMKMRIAEEVHSAAAAEVRRRVKTAELLEDTHTLVKKLSSQVDVQSELLTLLRRHLEHEEKEKVPEERKE